MERLGTYWNMTLTKKGRGITVIAIGGDKLSRGLTLEGLTISYYLRSSRMYDTLLQMGRWFGYKDGYIDYAGYLLQENCQGGILTLLLSILNWKMNLNPWLWIGWNQINTV